MAGRRNNTYAPLFMIDEHEYKGPFDLYNTNEQIIGEVVYSVTWTVFSNKINSELTPASTIHFMIEWSSNQIFLDSWFVSQLLSQVH